MSSETVRPKSLDLIELLGLDDGVGHGDGRPPRRLEVEGAPVLLRVPVSVAEGRPAPAPEPRQPHSLPARSAAARVRCRRWFTGGGGLDGCGWDDGLDIGDGGGG